MIGMLILAHDHSWNGRYGTMNQLDDGSASGTRRTQLGDASEGKNCLTPPTYDHAPPLRDVHAMAHPGLPPSDLGLDGALPLEPATWSIPSDHLLSDADWSAQNRKINDLLAGRAE